MTGSAREGEGALRESELVEGPLIPTFSPQAGRRSIARPRDDPNTRPSVPGWNARRRSTRFGHSRVSSAGDSPSATSCWRYATGRGADGVSAQCGRRFGVATNVSDDLKAGALAYHRTPRPGKLAIQATKPLATQHDLALAYTPGVAVACEAIAADPAEAATLTARANLVAVVTNGTAVLGLGNIGPLAGKPVMEGKA